ncbi:MAG TPA: hypothetical protein VIY29_05550 [Ktedonobacteraceae bacterium]
MLEETAQEIEVDQLVGVYSRPLKAAPPSIRGSPSFRLIVGAGSPCPTPIYRPAVPPSPRHLEIVFPPKGRRASSGAGVMLLTQN